MRRKRKPPKVDTTNWTRENIAWLAGLFEGEGCISLRDYITDPGPRFNLIVKMTDEDVIQNVRRIAGMGEIGGPYEEKSGTKPCWRWSAWNNQNCMALIYAMYPFLCGRRRAKIAAMIDMWVSLGRERGAQSELQLAA